MYSSSVTWPVLFVGLDVDHVSWPDLLHLAATSADEAHAVGDSPLWSASCMAMWAMNIGRADPVDEHRPGELCRRALVGLATTGRESHDQSPSPVAEFSLIVLTNRPSRARLGDVCSSATTVCGAELPATDVGPSGWHGSERVLTDAPLLLHLDRNDNNAPLAEEPGPTAATVTRGRSSRARPGRPIRAAMPKLDAQRLRPRSSGPSLLTTTNGGSYALSVLLHRTKSLSATPAIRP